MLGKTLFISTFFILSYGWNGDTNERLRWMKGDFYQRNENDTSLGDGLNNSYELNSSGPPNPSVLNYVNQTVEDYYPSFREFQAFLLFVQQREEEFEPDNIDDLHSARTVFHRLFATVTNSRKVEVAESILQRSIKGFLLSLRHDAFPLSFTPVFEYACKEFSDKDYCLLLDKIYLSISNNELDFNATKTVVQAILAKDYKSPSGVEKLSKNPWLYLVPYQNATLITHMLENLGHYKDIALNSIVPWFTLSRVDNTVGCYVSVPKSALDAKWPFYNRLLSGFVGIPPSCIGGYGNSEREEAKQLYAIMERLHLELYLSKLELKHKGIFMTFNSNKSDMYANYIFHSATISSLVGDNTVPEICRFFSDPKLFYRPLWNPIFNTLKPLYLYLFEPFAQRCPIEPIKKRVLDIIQKPYTKRTPHALITTLLTPLLNLEEKKGLETYSYRHRDPNIGVIGAVARRPDHLFKFNAIVRKIREKNDNMPMRNKLIPIVLGNVTESNVWIFPTGNPKIGENIARYYGKEWGPLLKQHWDPQLAPKYLLTFLEYAELDLLYGIVEDPKIIHAILVHETSQSMFERLLNVLRKREAERLEMMNWVEQNLKTNPKIVMKEEIVWYKRMKEKTSLYWGPMDRLAVRRNFLVRLFNKESSLSDSQYYACVLHMMNRGNIEDDSLIKRYQLSADNWEEGEAYLKTIDKSTACLKNVIPPLPPKERWIYYPEAY